MQKDGIIIFLSLMKIQYLSQDKIIAKFTQKTNKKHCKVKPEFHCIPSPTLKKHYNKFNFSRHWL